MDHTPHRAALDGPAAPWPSGAAHEPLLGREADLGRIGVFLASIPRVGGPLLLLGEPGVGKSAVLESVGRQAAGIGMRVLETTGVQYKAQPSFSALQQLLRPTADLRPAARSGVLAVAFGHGDGPAPEHEAVARAVVSLITDLSRDTPTLLLVDDLQWLDPASAVVLGLVARRLMGSRAGMLCAARPGAESFFDYSGLPTHDLGPLSDAASEALLAQHFPALALRVRRRLMDEAQGNPLALLELPVALTDSQRSAAQALPERLALSSRLQTAFASRITALPAATRHLLLIAALEGSGDLQVLRRAAAGRCKLKHLAPAEHAQLVQVDDAAGRLRFRHSLTRSAVVELASSDQRRSAHRALADAWAAAPERQAWHLAQAAVAPDERIAALLEHIATETGRRGDGPNAVAALLRAADLSPQGSERARRLGQAAYIGANLTGDLRGVPGLLDDARRAAPDGVCLASAVAGSVYLLNGSGDLDTAHRLLTGAIAQRPEPFELRDATLTEAMHTLLTVCFFGGRPELWTAFDDALAKYAEAPELLTLTRSTLVDPARASTGELAALDAMVATLAVESDPTRIVRVAAAGVYSDRLGGCAQALEGVARGARTGENVVPAINALFLLGDHALLTGQWSQLRQFAYDGLDLCEEYHCPMLAWPGKFLLACAAAVRGELPAVRSLTDQMDQWAGPRRADAVHAYAAHARALAALSQGDFEAAYQHAVMVAPAGTLPRCNPHALWLVMDLVDAAVRTGRRAEARAHAAAAREAGLERISPRMRMLVLAATALASEDEYGDAERGTAERGDAERGDAERGNAEHGDTQSRRPGDTEHGDTDNGNTVHGDTASRGLAAALAVEGAERWPFDLARIRLYHGERLRRAKSTAQAREHLAAAAQLFRRLGAAPWAERAQQELRACGGHAPDPTRTAASALTPQQWEIARLAAAGLTNKQIGEKLFLSPRTVSTHLYQVFPKLGVTSRAALRDALETLAGE